VRAEVSLGMERNMPRRNRMVQGSAHFAGEANSQQPPPVAFYAGVLRSRMGLSNGWAAGIGALRHESWPATPWECSRWPMRVTTGMPWDGEFVGIP
jgi:hypothetical protein